jgi:hypothetical protein
MREREWEGDEETIYRGVRRKFWGSGKERRGSEVDGRDSAGESTLVGTWRSVFSL